MSSDFRFSIEELSGSLADIGSMVPFILGAVLIGDYLLTPVLLMFGVAHLVTGLYYKVPLSVQPMKAVGTLIIAEGMTYGQVVGAGIVVGMFFLLMGISGAVSHIAGMLPKSIIRGTQLGMALIIAVKAFDIISLDPVSGILGCIVISIFFIAGRGGISAIVVIAMGFMYVILTSGIPGHFPVIVLSPYIPHTGEIMEGALKGALPQIPLTLVNAVLATSLIISDLYSRDVRPGKLAVSTGIMNLVSAPIGGLPMCHGSSGVAAHYKFGARTGGSNVIMGVILMAIAIFIPPDFLILLPKGITGALLIFAGYELGRHFGDTESLILTLFVAGMSLITNIGIGFFAGVLLLVLSKKALFLKNNFEVH